MAAGGSVVAVAAAVAVGCVAQSDTDLEVHSSPETMPQPEVPVTVRREWSAIGEAMQTSSSLAC